MPVLQMREARFARGDRTLAGPVTCELDEGERAALPFETPREADIVAKLASACVKATDGSIFIGGYDPRIQPVQCKRIVGYVPHELAPTAFSSIEEYVRYRSALWSLDADDALTRALALYEQLGDDVHESFAYPLIGALIARPSLLVLERPQAAYAARILNVVENAALLTTHASAREAQAFV